MKRKYCKRCGNVGAVINFCNPCVRIIQDAHENITQRAEAAVGYLRARKPEYNGHNDDAQRRYKELEMAAFLSVFHPEMSDDKAARLVREGERGEQP